MCASKAGCNHLSAAIKPMIIHLRVHIYMFYNRTDDEEEKEKNI